jgi:hypothetical protein
MVLLPMEIWTKLQGNLQSHAAQRHTLAAVF